jgi:hypothetical protein
MFLHARQEPNLAWRAKKDRVARLAGGSPDQNAGSCAGQSQPLWEERTKRKEGPSRPTRDPQISGLFQALAE